MSLWSRQWSCSLSQNPIASSPRRASNSVSRLVNRPRASLKTENLALARAIIRRPDNARYGKKQLQAVGTISLDMRVLTPSVSISLIAILAGTYQRHLQAQNQTQPDENSGQYLLPTKRIVNGQDETIAQQRHVVEKALRMWSV